MLRLCGAEVIEVPAVPFKGPNNYVHKLSEKHKKGRERTQRCVVCQPMGQHIQPWGIIVRLVLKFGNKRMVKSMVCMPSVPAARWPELACSKGSNRLVKTAAADPMGAAMYNYIKTGELKSEGSSISGGIGKAELRSRWCPLDDAYKFLTKIIARRVRPP